MRLQMALLKGACWLPHRVRSPALKAVITEKALR
jgi:hypothetical protein